MRTDNAAPSPAASASEVVTAERRAVEPLAVFEATWLLRYRSLSREVATGVTILGKLCADTATSRALLRGDQAARAEVLRAFLSLSQLQARFARELEPAPDRFCDRAKLLRRALAEIDTASAVYVNATDQVIDLDGIDLVNRHLERATRLFAAAIATSVQVSDPAPAKPKTPRARKTRPTDDC